MTRHTSRYSTFIVTATATTLSFLNCPFLRYHPQPPLFPLLPPEIEARPEGGVIPSTLRIVAEIAAAQLLIFVDWLTSKPAHQVVFQFCILLVENFSLEILEGV